MSKIVVTTKGGEVFEVSTGGGRDLATQAKELARNGAMNVKEDGEKNAATYHPPHQIKKVYFEE